eukprot:6193139-Pleurochrysis_carterae.AAC.2
MLLRLKDVLVLSNASHNLISLGRLAKEAHVGLRVQATSGHALLLSLPYGKTIPPLNVGVLVVPTSESMVAASPAFVAQGNRKSVAQTPRNSAFASESQTRRSAAPFAQVHA